MGVAFFAFVVVAFFAGAFFVVAVVFCLETRPDLVFLRTVGTSWTAGAGAAVFVALGFAALLVAVLALGFAAALGLGAAFALVVLVAAFLGATAFFATLGLAAAFSFYRVC